LDDVHDLFVSDVDDNRALIEETSHVLAECLALLLLDLREVHVSTRAPHGPKEVAGELQLQLISLVDRVFIERPNHMRGT
jgi:hypothetical protein